MNERDLLLNRRADDIAERMYVPTGWRTRADIIRFAVWALPAEDDEHTAAVITHGRFREMVALGMRSSQEANERTERFLGWFREDADLSALATELQELRDELHLAGHEAAEIFERVKKLGLA